MELKFFPINIFRETPKVTFFDAGIDSSNSSDVVIHSGEAISPPDNLKDEQYYVHNHQIDHNLVITGERKFVLINPSWDEPHHVIYLNRYMGALEIPIGTYHRSISGKEGSIVLNQPKRDKFFDPAKEFIPQKLDKINLIKARKSPPVYWIFENNKIKRVYFNPLERKVKTLVWNEKKQKEYVRALKESEIIISTGPAGTGKTFLAVAVALTMLLEKKIERR